MDLGLWRGVGYSTSRRRSRSASPCCPPPFPPGLLWGSPLGSGVSWSWLSQPQFDHQSSAQYRLSARCSGQTEMNSQHIPELMRGRSWGVCVQRHFRYWKPFEVQHRGWKLGRNGPRGDHVGCRGRFVFSAQHAVNAVL